MDHATMSLPQTSTSYIKRVQELNHMTMVAWRSYHKHLGTEVIGISFLHQVKAVGCSTHRHTMNTEDNYD